MKAAFFKTINELAKEDRDLVFIKGDTAYMPDYQKAFPSQYLDVGIAEQNMIGVAAGMALEGKHPITYSIVNFATMRCLEQIRNDIAYHNLNVKVISCGQGFDYGNLGATHHATEDLAIMRVIPNMIALCPCDPVEAVAVTKAAVRYNGPCFIRMGHGGEPVLHHDPIEEYQIGKALTIIEGSEIVLCASGSIAGDACAAAEKLRGEGYDAGVYSFPTIKPIDRDFILDKLNTADMLLSVEEHNIIGGFGSAMAEIIAEAGPHKALFCRIGIKDTFSNEIGSREYLKKTYEINCDAIVDVVKRTLKKQ